MFSRFGFSVTWGALVAVYYRFRQVLKEGGKNSSLNDCRLFFRNFKNDEEGYLMIEEEREVVVP